MSSVTCSSIMWPSQVVYFPSPLNLRLFWPTEHSRNDTVPILAVALNWPGSFCHLCPFGMLALGIHPLGSQAPCCEKQKLQELCAGMLIGSPSWAPSQQLVSDANCMSESSWNVQPSWIFRLKSRHLAAITWETPIKNLLDEFSHNIDL